MTPRPRKDFSLLNIHLMSQLIKYIDSWLLLFYSTTFHTGLVILFQKDLGRQFVAVSAWVFLSFFILSDAATPKGRVILGQTGSVMVIAYTCVVMAGLYLKLLPGTTEVALHFGGFLEYNTSQMTLGMGFNLLLFTGKLAFYAFFHSSRYTVGRSTTYRKTA